MHQSSGIQQPVGLSPPTAEKPRQFTLNGSNLASDFRAHSPGCAT